MQYKCENCKKIFKRIYELDRHKIRKNKCYPKILDTNRPINNIPVNYTQNTHIDTIDNKTSTQHTQQPHFINTSKNTSLKMSNNIPKLSLSKLKNVLQDGNTNLYYTEPLYKSESISINKPKKDYKNYCKNCEKDFSRSDSLKRHQLFYCLPKDDDSKETTNNVITLLSQMNERQRKIDEEHKQERLETKTIIAELKNTITDLQTKIKSEPTITNNTTNNTTNNINITNNVVFKFGTKIDHSLIPTEKLIQILNQGAHKTVPLMVEEIHCNFRHPQYHNIYISDKRSKEAIVFNGKQYQTVYIDDAIEELDTRMKSHINDRFYIIEGLLHNEEKFLQKFSETDKNMIEKRLRILNDYEDDSPDQKKSNKMVKYVLCDYKETIKDTRKKLEKNLSKKKKLASTQQLNIPTTN